MPVDHRALMTPASPRKKSGNGFMWVILVSLGFTTVYFATSYMEMLATQEVALQLRRSYAKPVEIRGSRSTPVARMTRYHTSPRLEREELVFINKHQPLATSHEGAGAQDESEELSSEQVRAREPRLPTNGTDFTSLATVFEYFVRDERFAAQEISLEQLKAAGLGKSLLLYHVQTAVLPLFRRVQSVVRLPPKTPPGEAVRRVKRGDWLVGVALVSGKSSLWLRTGRNEFAPIYSRVQGRAGVIVHMKVEARIPAFKELNTKPFERKSRECSLIREFTVRSACFKHAHALRETRRILKEFDLLRVGLAPNVTGTPEPDVSRMDFNQQMQLLFRPMSEAEICESCEWTQCTLHPFCTWTYDVHNHASHCIHEVMQHRPPKQGVFPRDIDTYNRSLDFVDDPNDGKRYFVYQPSGGFNNQRIQLETALTICLLANRTCVVPHAAQHTNFYFRYNLHPAERTISMQRIFDFGKLRSIVDVVTVPESMSLIDWIESVGGMPYIGEASGLRQDTSLTGGWRVVMRDARRMLAKYVWREADIRRFQTDPSRFLFFANHTMWGTIDLQMWSANYKAVRNALTYTRPLKRLALSFANDLGIYNALHVRRGDKKREAGFVEVVRDADVYAQRMLPHQGISDLLYVATDEKDPAYFDPVRDKGFKVVTWRDLDQNRLLDYVLRFPPQMFRDVLGMVEQLICTHSQWFLGSSYSTFTMFILRMRRFYPLLGLYNTTSASGELVPVLPLGRTETNLDSFTSNCNPFRPESHKLPC